MADRLLLESSSTDGYLLEDGSGVLLLEAFSIDAYEDEISTDGPSFYSRMEEASGHLVDEVSALASTTESGVTYQAAGPVATSPQNYAISLSGSSSRVSWPNNSVFNLGDVFTIEFSIYRTATGLACVIDKGTTGGTAYCLYMTSGGNLRLSRGLGGTGIAISTAFIDLPQWYHVMVTKNGATVNIYVNGSEGHTNETAFTLTDTTGTFDLGMFSDSSQFLNSRIARLALYKTALSGARVTAHYNAWSAVPSVNLGFPYTGGGYYG